MKKNLVAALGLASVVLTAAAVISVAYFYDAQVCVATRSYPGGVR